MYVNDKSIIAYKNTIAASELSELVPMYFNPTSLNDNDIGQQQQLLPSKSNEEPTQKNGMNPEQAQTTSKSS